MRFEPLARHDDVNDEELYLMTEWLEESLMVHIPPATIKRMIYFLGRSYTGIRDDVIPMTVNMMGKDINITNEHIAHTLAQDMIALGFSVTSSNITYDMINGWFKSIEKSRKDGKKIGKLPRRGKSK